MGLEMYISRNDPLFRYINRIESEVALMAESSDGSHDITHLYRVLRYGLDIQSKEGGKRIVIGLAGFLHDIHGYLKKTDGDCCSPRESILTVKMLIKDLKLDSENKNHILYCIEHHENYSGLGERITDKEALIVQDADILDSMGAVGIARYFMSNGADQLLPLKFGSGQKGFAMSSLDDFGDDLLGKIYMLNTETARKIAVKRQKYARDFLSRLEKEMKGEL